MGNSLINGGGEMVESLGRNILGSVDQNAFDGIFYHLIYHNSVI